MKVEYAGISAPGLAHEENEDRALLGMRQLVSDGKAVCGSDCASRAFAVFDGVGGHALGAQAAEEALGAFSRACARERLQPASFDGGAEPAVGFKEALESALRRSDDALARLHAAGRAGYAAAAGIAFDGRGSAAAFNAGDVRVYRYRAPFAARLTKDHSLAETWRDERGENESVPADIAHVITRCLGKKTPAPHSGNPAWPFDVVYFPVRPGDAFLVCTDGVWEFVSDEDIEGTLGDAETPEALARSAAALVAMVRGRGSTDDATAVVARVS